MKQSTGFCQFTDAFKVTRPNNFSYAGLRALFDYLEEYEESTGEEIELDVVALCCEYTEYSSLEEFQGAYSTEYETVEDIQEATQFIRIDDDAFIIQDF